MVERNDGYKGTKQNVELSPFDEITKVLQPLGEFFAPEEMGCITSYFHNRLIELVNERNQRLSVRAKRLAISFRWGTAMALSEFLVETRLGFRQWQSENHVARQQRIQERVIELSERAGMVLGQYPSKMADMEHDIKNLQAVMEDAVLPSIDRFGNTTGEGTGLLVQGASIGLGTLAKFIGFSAGYAAVMGAQVLNEIRKKISSRIENRLLYPHES